MGNLTQFLSSPSLRFLVVSACTARKACGVLEKGALLTAEGLDDPVRRKEGEMRLEGYCLPAAEMYTGAGHMLVRRAVQSLRKHGYDVSHFILSAGYGLLSERDLIVPYNVTFAGASKAWIRERGQRLQLRNRLVAVANKYDGVILILGREYLEALSLPLPTELLPCILAYVAPSFIMRLGKGVETIPVGEVERREVRAYSSSAKEKRFHLDVQRTLRTGGSK